MSAPALEHWRDRHRGETLLVCGCGRSLADLPAHPGVPVIGVNDMGRRFDPDYLLVVNPRAQFPPERFAAIAATRAKAVFTSLSDPGFTHRCTVPFRLGQRGGTDIAQPGQLPYTRNSPYIALALALLMGARRIGLLGVDFAEDHFFGPTGPHPLTRELAQIDREYAALARAAAAMGREIVNLSAVSRLSALPRARPEHFLGRPGPQPARRRVLHLAQTNCAGAIFKLHRLMRADGRVESRVATASALTRGATGRARRFPQDIAFHDTAAMQEAIARADLLHFHNFIDAQSPCLARFRPLLRGKPAVLQLHSEPAVVAPHFPGRDPRTRRDLPVLVVAQKQARFYPEATPVLNALDPAEFGPVAGPEPGPPRLVFTPTDLADYPDPAATCRGKGYRATRAILLRLQSEGLIRASIATDLDWTAAMALSDGAAGKIDECVTGGYHLTSLEALAQGLATFAWLDETTRALIATMTGAEAATLPWVSTPLAGLEARLREMAARPAAFAEAGAAGRDWITRHWTKNAVLDPIFAAYDRAAAPVTVPAIVPKPRATTPAPGTVTASRSGRARPRRSEDFPQTIRLTPTLLARQDSEIGRIVHVLGNGPSLADADFAAMAGDCVIGVNAAVLVVPQLGRPLDVYCVSDRRFLSTPEGLAMAREARTSMRVLAGYCAGFLPDPDINYVEITPGPGASADLRRGLQHGCSVALFAAQLAAWLGAADIRLYGMECDYAAGRFDAGAGRAQPPHDTHIYPRVAACAGALAAILARDGRRLCVVGPSRLTGGFGATPVADVTALPLAPRTAGRQPSGAGATARRH